MDIRLPESEGNTAPLFKRTNSNGEAIESESKLLKVAGHQR